MSQSIFDIVEGIVLADKQAIEYITNIESNESMNNITDIIEEY